MLKNKAILLVFLVSIIPLCSPAQDTSATNTTYSGGAGSFQIGYGNFQTNKLQNFLPAGAPSLGNHHLTVGGGGYAMINDFIIGGSGFSITGETVSTSNLEANASGGAGFFNVGYRVAGGKALNVYPLLGIGGGGLGMEINQTANLTTSDIRSNPGRAITIEQSGWLFDLSMNLEWYPIAGGNENDYGGLMAGLKVGYLYQPFADDWEYEGGDISNTPNFNLSGFYVQLTLGAGGFSIDQDDKEDQ